MNWPKVGSCPMCGAPIYNKPIVFADSKNTEREPIFDVVRDEDGLPKNFFTCECRLPKFQHLIDDGKVSEVDIDRIHRQVEES